MKGAKPEIELAGGTALQHNLRDLCRKVHRGRIIRLIHVQTGRHRAWFLRSRPEGCEPERITLHELAGSIGRVLDDIRDGTVYQVWNGTEHRTVGYLSWSAPEWLCELLGSAPMTYVYRSKSGREIRRDFYPLAVRAEPVPRRRGVLASG